MKSNYKMGIDIGSTTIKVVVIDEKNEIIYEEYRRHLSNIKVTIVNLLKETYQKLGDLETRVCVTGSGGLMISQWLGIPFVQEVVASTLAVDRVIPKTEVAIELGGEDAKITFFTGTIEQRMNGKIWLQNIEDGVSCAISLPCSDNIRFQEDCHESHESS